MAHRHHGDCCERKIHRRDMLRRLGQAALLPAALVAAGETQAASLPARPLGPQVNVFRLSPVPRGQNARRNICCNACHLHAQNKYFATAEAANALRAHRGCDCAIVVERISIAVFNQMFLPIPAFGNRLRRVEFDLRWA